MGHEQEIICAVYEGDNIVANASTTHTVSGNDVGANTIHPTVGADTIRPIVGAKHCEPVYNKIIFNTKNLPIKIAGMSDVMPYESMRYSELASDEKKLSLWMGAFDKKIREVLTRFKPDLIICHHLYLLTALVVNIISKDGLLKFAPTDTEIDPMGAGSASVRPYNEETYSSHLQEITFTRPLVYGICHNTDLRQYQQTDIKRDFIKENIKKLDKCFFLSKENANNGIELFDLDRSKIEIIGIGYNSKIFKNNRAHLQSLVSRIGHGENVDDNITKKPVKRFPRFVIDNKTHGLCIYKGISRFIYGIFHSKEKNEGCYDSIIVNDSSSTNNIKLLYVGKVCKKKGVLSLVKAIKLLNDENITLDIVGGAGNKDEYDEIINESENSKSKINFIPPMNQDKLAVEYNNHDIFILPSFFEGMPLVPLEAMACGCKVVISDLPGVKKFYNANVKNACIKYVELPKLTNVDDARSEDLEAFEKRLANAIRESVDDKSNYKPDLSNISWENIARRIIE